MPRNNPLFNQDGELEHQNTQVAHLYEIEIGKFKLLEDAAAGDIVVYVDKPDKIFPDTYLFYSYKSSDAIYDIVYVEVDSVNINTNQITLKSGLMGNLNKGSYMVEGLYPEGQDCLYYTVGSVSKLDIHTASFGALNGRLLLTDYDEPIVAPIKRYVFQNQDCSDAVDGYGVYFPYPIKYDNTSTNKTGEKSQVSIVLSNVDQLVGATVIKHEGLANNNVEIKTAYMQDATPMVFTLMYNNSIEFYADEDIQEYTPVELTDILTEFKGIIDNIGITPKAVTFTCFNNIDDRKTTTIPRRTYTALRCPFVYKGPRCRFKSDMILKADIGTDNDITIEIASETAKQYFSELKDDETAIIKIGNELVKVKDYAAISDWIKLPAGYRSLTENEKLTIIVDESHHFYIKIVERGYGGTDIVSHTAGEPIDIPACKKTFHDCKLHFNDYHYGGFIGVPKNIV